MSCFTLVVKHNLLTKSLRSFVVHAPEPEVPFDLAELFPVIRQYLQ